MPEALDDSTIHLTISAAVLLVYSDDAGQVSLVVGQSPSPTVTVSGGATLEQFRSFLLSVPGLPADTIDQLQAIDDWTQTLPIPVPQDARSRGTSRLTGRLGSACRTLRRGTGSCCGSVTAWCTEWRGATESKSCWPSPPPYNSDHGFTYRWAGRAVRMGH